MSERKSILDGDLLNALETLDLYIHQPTNGHYSGARPSRAYGSSPEFADYREYAAGDDLRRIDWNLAGRFNKLYIKRFIDEKQGRNRIYLDQSASMGFDEQKGWTALRLAAALGYLSVSNMDCVSYCLLSGEVCRDLCGSIIGRESFLSAVKKLDAVEFSGAVDVLKAVCADPSPGFSDGVSYLISDLLTESNWKAAVDNLLGRGRQVAVIQVLSPEELAPSVRSTCSFRDSEGTAGRMHVDVDRSMLNAYEQAVQFFLEDARHFCASRGAQFMMVRSDERVEEVLLTKGCAEEVIR